jgi:hypothetical protein
VFNLDTCGYANDLTSLEQVLAEVGAQACHTLLRGGISAMPRPRRTRLQYPLSITKKISSWSRIVQSAR